MNASDNRTHLPDERFVNSATACYIGIILTIGLIGNSFVLYIYGFRFKTSPFNIIIVFMAVMDLLFCIINMPLEIANMTHAVEFEGCKAIATISTLTATSTGQSLVVIAALRFRAVCHPLKLSISNFLAKCIVAMSFLISVLMSWPNVVLMTNVHQPVVDGLYVVNCAVESEYKETSYLILYNGLELLIFLTALIAIIILYSLTGSRLLKRKKYGLSTDEPKFGLQSKQTTVYTVCDTVTCEETLYKKTLSQKGFTPPTKESSEDVNNLTPSGDKSQHTNRRLDKKLSLTGSSENADKLTKKDFNKRLSVISQTGSKSSNKLTPVKMLIIMTLIFFLSYVPHLSLVIYIGFGWPLELTPVSESILGILIRSYLISSACNPIVYGCYNRKFRAEVTVLFSSLRNKTIKV